MNETRRRNSAAESIYAINAALLAMLFLLGRSFWMILALAGVIGLLVFGGVIA